MITLTANTYYILIGIIIALSAIIFGLIISYFITLRRLSGFEKKENEIIEAAQKKAAEIIEQAQQIHETSDASLQKAAEEMVRQEEAELSKKSAQVLKAYEDKIEEMNANNVSDFNATSDEMKKTVNLHFDEMKKLLSEQTVASEQMAAEKVKQEYDALEKELQDYKTKQMDKINRNIYQILLNVSKAVFGKSLDTKEHEQMIIDALTEAEKQFN